MGKPLRILIIEDSEEDTQVFVRELRQGGYEVEFEHVETAQAVVVTESRYAWMFPAFGRLPFALKC